MAKPSTPEFDAVNSQLANLKLIVSGADWWTNLGAGAGMYSIPGESPVLSCWPSEISTNVDPESGVGTITITWVALVPLDGEDSTPALAVIADMRAALVAECRAGDPEEVAATWTDRVPGSNYATVTITVQSTMISGGRSV